MRTKPVNGEQDDYVKTDLAGLIHQTAFCDRVGIDPRTARRWASTGYGPPVRKVGGRVYYAEAEVDAWLLTIRTSSSVVA